MKAGRLEEAVAPSTRERLLDQVQRALAGFLTAHIGLSALRARAMRQGEVAMPPDGVARLKALEAARDAALRQAREAAAEALPDMVADDVATWDASIAAAVAALDFAARDFELRAVVEGRGPGDELGQQMAAGLELLAWSLTDMPIALVILRTGLRLRAVAVP